MKWVEGKIIDQKQWSDELFSLYVEAPIMPFVAGQFTQIAIEHENEILHRPYSFVNSPSDAHLEFYYDIIKGGTLTPFLAKLRPNDKLMVAQKAAGRFILAHVPSAPQLWLIATGTGLGVFLSLLKTNEPWERFENIILVHSVRYAGALSHQTLIQDWQQRYTKRFNFIPIVTREATAFSSDRITTQIENGNIEKLRNLTISSQNSQVMLCGNPTMVTEVSRLLQDRGLVINHPHRPGHITVESYWKAS